jgi:hypothetical protein
MLVEVRVKTGLKLAQVALMIYDGLHCPAMVFIAGALSMTRSWCTTEPQGKSIELAAAK